MPSMCAWRDELEGLLSANAAKHRANDWHLCGFLRSFRALAMRQLQLGLAACTGLEREAGQHLRCCLCTAKLCTGRSLPVRLEPRDRCSGRCDDHGEGRACTSLPQPDAVRASLSARDAGDGVRCPVWWPWLRAYIRECDPAHAGTGVLANRDHNNHGTDPSLSFDVSVIEGTRRWGFIPCSVVT